MVSLRASDDRLDVLFNIPVRFGRSRGYPSASAVASKLLGAAALRGRIRGRIKWRGVNLQKTGRQ